MTDADRELVLMVAIDALPRDEHERALAAIEADPELSAELAELRAALAGLHDDATVTPPPALRERVLAAIGDVDQLRALRVVGGQAGAPPTPPGRRLRSRLLGISTAAAVVALVAGLVAWFALGRSSDEDDEIAAVVESPEAATIELHGELEGLRITYVPGGDEAVIHGKGIDDPGDDRAYQLWFVDGDAPVASEVFQPDVDGEVGALVEGFNAGTSEYAVTIEPESGSEAPTGEIEASTG